MELKFLCEPYHLSPGDSNTMGLVQVSSYDDADLFSADAFILGYKECRNSDNPGCENAADTIRQKLYELNTTSKPLRVCDLGNCRKGDTVAESYENLRQCVEQLACYEKPVVVFGGTQEAVCFLAKASFGTVQYPSAAFVDAKIDVETETDDFSNRNYLNRLDKENPSMRLIHIANQEYLATKYSFAWLAERNFPSLRLGECNADIRKSEPLTRDAQLVALDMNSVRFSDSPAGLNANGLYAEKACQIAWNSGFSPRMNMFFLSEYNPAKDIENVSAQLGAEIVWHVLDGISQRRQESGDFSEDIYLKRYVKHPMLPQDVCFYESTLSQMMWVEVPVGKTPKKRIIPCSPEDYNSFRSGYIPDYWMLEFQRLMK